MDLLQACLKPQHLSAFAHVSSDPRAQHYSRVIQRAGRTDRTKVRNHRYAALRALQKGRDTHKEEKDFLDQMVALYQPSTMTFCPELLNLPQETCSLVVLVDCQLCCCLSVVTCQMVPLTL